MTRFAFRLPDIGEGIAKAEIVEWHASEGDTVKEGQAVVSVMTNKATIEMEAPTDGILLERSGDIGDQIPVGSILFVLETGQDVPAGESDLRDEVPTMGGPALAQKQQQGPPDSGAEGAGSVHRVRAAPAVRQRARTLGIDLASLAGAGEMVRHEDLDTYLLAKGTRLPSPPRHNVPAEAELPLTGLRRQIAHRMQDAKRHIPHFTYVEEIDVTDLEALREERNRAAGGGERLHLLPFLVVALCHALREFPLLNAHYDDEREVLIRFDSVHVGIATQTEAGLMVPVLRNADDMDVSQVAEGIARLAERARSGAIAGDELSGSTITVTSLGKLGGIAATPIINRPEVAILAPHRILDRPVLTGNALVLRKSMNLSISCDHRVVDGYVAARFVQSIRRLLEAPRGY